MIITEESHHLDHGLSPAVVAYFEERFADRSEFFIETIELAFCFVRCTIAQLEVEPGDHLYTCLANLLREAP